MNSENHYSLSHIALPEKLDSAEETRRFYIVCKNMLWNEGFMAAVWRNVKFYDTHKLAELACDEMRAEGASFDAIAQITRRGRYFTGVRGGRPPSDLRPDLGADYGSW